MKTVKCAAGSCGILISLLLLWQPVNGSAHCDGIDGPVVKAAQQALAEGNPNLVLIWVQARDEAEIKRAFDKTLKVRKLNSEARELADRYFFETVVRVHRAGEGAAYTGLKPAGRDLGPAIPAADRAIETGDIKPLRALLSEEFGRGLQNRFYAVQGTKKFEKNDLKAGREFVHAYVGYIHYVEELHATASSSAHEAAPKAAECEMQPKAATAHH